MSKRKAAEKMVDAVARKVKTAMDEVSTSGAFVRTESTYRQFINGSDGRYPAEKGRYHVYVSLACPWASRVLMLRKLKRLDNVISVSVTAPVMEKTRPDDDDDKHFGWVFKTAAEEDGCIPDMHLDAKTVRELYELSANYDPSNPKYTVPILFDTKSKSIVSNESAEIIRMFNSEFNEFAENPELDLYPEPLRAKIDEVNDWVLKYINNGVYRCGFSQSQEAYDEAVVPLFEHLDRVEEILSKSRYLVGNQLTEADVRLFTSLVRFDEVYHGHFKCNKKRIDDYPNMINYVREVYQIPGVAETVNMTHIKKHYHRSHPLINKFGIVPIGPGVDFTLPHNRHEMK